MAADLYCHNVGISTHTHTHTHTSRKKCQAKFRRCLNVHNIITSSIYFADLTDWFLWWEGIFANLHSHYWRAVRLTQHQFSSMNILKYSLRQLKGWKKQRRLIHSCTCRGRLDNLRWRSAWCYAAHKDCIILPKCACCFVEGLGKKPREDERLRSV